MEWYKQNHIRRDIWIMEHFKDLELSMQELHIVLYIEFLNSIQKQVTLPLLSEYSKLDLYTVDSILNTLMEKKYLIISKKENKIGFEIDGIFMDSKPDTVIKDLFDLYEHEFKRPLSQNEMMMLSDWRKKYDEKDIVNALREASILKKLNFNYIDRILINNYEKK